jgi:hypothetical protein
MRKKPDLLYQPQLGLLPDRSRGAPRGDWQLVKASSKNMHFTDLSMVKRIQLVFVL